MHKKKISLEELDNVSGGDHQRVGSDGKPNGVSCMICSHCGKQHKISDCESSGPHFHDCGNLQYKLKCPDCGTWDWIE